MPGPEGVTELAEDHREVLAAVAQLPRRQHVVTWRNGHLTLLDTGEQTYAGDDQFTWLSSSGYLLTSSTSPTFLGR